MQGEGVLNLSKALKALLGGSTHQSMDLVALRQEQLREVAPVLTGDPGDQSTPRHSAIQPDRHAAGPNGCAEAATRLVRRCSRPGSIESTRRLTRSVWAAGCSLASTRARSSCGAAGGPVTTTQRTGRSRTPWRTPSCSSG